MLTRTQASTDQQKLSRSWRKRHRRKALKCGVNLPCLHIVLGSTLFVSKVTQKKWWRLQESSTTSFLTPTGCIVKWRGTSKTQTRDQCRSCYLRLCHRYLRHRRYRRIVLVSCILFPNCCIRKLGSLHPALLRKKHLGVPLSIRCNRKSNHIGKHWD